MNQRLFFQLQVFLRSFSLTSQSFQQGSRIVIKEDTSEVYVATGIRVDLSQDITDTKEATKSDSAVRLKKNDLWFSIRQ